MTGRQHSIVKHRENYFFIPLEDDYLLAYMLLAEKLDPIKEAQGKRLSGSSDCKAMIASVLEAWMNSKRPSAQSEDDLFSYFTIDQIVSELRGRYKRSMIIQCLQEMEEEGEYTDSEGEVHKGTIKKRPYKQNISSYALNLPVIQALLNELPAQSPYGVRNHITLGRPKKNSPKTDGLKISPKINGINLDGINESQSKNGQINPINQSKNGLSFYTQNSIITQNSINTEREGATSDTSSIAHVSNDTHATPSSSQSHPLNDFVIYDNFADPHVVTILLSNDPEVNKYRRRCYEDMRHAFVLQEREITFKFVQEVESDVITGTVVDAANSPSSLQETIEESTPAPSDEQSSKQADTSSHSQSHGMATSENKAKQAPSEQGKTPSGKGNKGSQANNAAKKPTPGADEKALRKQVQQWIDEKRGYRLYGSGTKEQIFSEQNAVNMFALKLLNEQQGNHEEGCTWDELDYLWKVVRTKDPYWSKDENRSRVGGYALQQQFATVVLGKYRPAKLKQMRNQNAAQGATQTGTNMSSAVQEHRQMSDLERRNAELRAKYGQKQIS